MSNSTFPILTPETPLAFLPQSTGLQLQASGYLYIATVSAFIWDALTALPEDVKILRAAKFSLPILAYWLSRMTTFAFLAMAMLFQVAPIGNCQNLQTAMGWCFAAAVPITSSLFLFRIAAVFRANRPVVIFFVIAWLATVGCSILTPFAIGGAHIASTSRCINTTLKPIVLAGTIANACNDTLVFIALSWRLSYNSTASGFAGRSRSVVHGKGLPKLSRTLLQSGQLYYLATVGFNILTLAMYLASPVPPVFRSMFSVPNVALENAMACRVFRALRLGFIVPDSESEITTSVLLTSFNTNQPRLP
ncbi:hypothetical protein C8R44DRAFT_836822, partial [Mycena epipterygia]